MNRPSPTAEPLTAEPAVTGRVVPRPVFCPIADLHTDVSVADDAVAGRFRHAGVLLELGNPPDWTRDPYPADEEWLIEFSKLYEGLDLAHAYGRTGDHRYLAAWQLLVGSWIDLVPVDRHSSDVLARRVQNWVYAWQGFARAPGFPGLDPVLERRILASIAEQADHLASHLTAERNHRTLELYALLVVFLALPALDPDGGRAADALRLLGENLLTDVWADGVHRERSTHYHLIALRSFVAARVNATRYGLPLPAGYDQRLAAGCRFGLHLHRPDGEIPATSDSDGGSYRDLLLLAGQELDDPELRWFGSAGAEGTPPAEVAVDFPVGGYHVQRSGWEGGDQERFLLLGAGPLGDGGHGHYDALAVEVYGRGRPLLVDPGRYTYAEPAPGSDGPNWRHRFKGTAAHSTVLVDGLDQTPYRRGKPKGPTAFGRLLGRHRGDGLDVLTAEAVSPRYDAVHRRSVIFVRDGYWLVVDVLRAPRDHSYQARWQLAAGRPGEPAAVLHDRADGPGLEAPGMLLALPPRHTARLEQGWVSREYGVRQPAPVLVEDAGPVTDAVFATLLLPTGERPADPARLPAVHLEGGLREPLRLTVELPGPDDVTPGRRDRVGYGPDGWWLASTELAPVAAGMALLPRPPAGAREEER
jgi:hypothetical protein